MFPASCSNVVFVVTVQLDVACVGLGSGFELRPKWSRVEANFGDAIDNSLLLPVGLVCFHPLESRVRALHGVVLHGPTNKPKNT
jgi:hypothetical protein